MKLGVYGEYNERIYTDESELIDVIAEAMTDFDEDDEEKAYELATEKADSIMTKAIIIVTGA